jgi:hypothetical protein
MGWHFCQFRVRKHPGCAYTSPATILFQTRECVGFAVCVLGEPDGLRCGGDEAYHGVFPIPNVITELVCQYYTAPVEREEVEVKYIYRFSPQVIPWYNDDYACLLFGKKTAFKPFRILANVVVAGQIHGIRNTVQTVEIGKREGRIWYRYLLKLVVERRCVPQVCCERGGTVRV